MSAHRHDCGESPHRSSWFVRAAPAGSLAEKEGSSYRQALTFNVELGGVDGV